MSDTEHAIRRLAQEKGWFVLKMPNDIWDFSRNGAVKTLFCTQRALDWLQSL